MRKVAIVGAGAVGSVIGALLDQAREEVYLIGRRTHVQAINRNRGLFMDGVKGEIRARVRALETLDFRPDMVLLTVKTQDVIPMRVGEDHCIFEPLLPQPLGPKGDIPVGQGHSLTGCSGELAQFIQFFPGWLPGGLHQF